MVCLDYVHCTCVKSRITFAIFFKFLNGKGSVDMLQNKKVAAKGLCDLFKDAQLKISEKSSNTLNDLLSVID